MMVAGIFENQSCGQNLNKNMGTRPKKKTFSRKVWRTKRRDGADIPLKLKADGRHTRKARRSNTELAFHVDKILRFHRKPMLEKISHLLLAFSAKGRNLRLIILHTKR